jgi:hypothetical protein
MSKKKATKATPKKAKEAPWQDRFLELFAISLNVALSAQGAGVNRTTVYREAERNNDFADKWNEAKQSAIERLEASAYDRAHKTSDTLLIFLLKSHKPGIYRETHHIQTTQLNINYADLTQPQLERLANGEDPATVISTKRDS